MNRLLVFLGGLLAGIALTLAVMFVLSRSVESMDSDGATDSKTEAENERNRDGVTYFEEPGDIINEKSFRVFQVIADDAALVMGGNDYLGTIYAIVNDEKKYYYDDERIKVPKGKVVRQIGIYKYPTKNEIVKTVPIIMITDK